MAALSSEGNSVKTPSFVPGTLEVLSALLVTYHFHSVTFLKKALCQYMIDVLLPQDGKIGLIPLSVLNVSFYLM